MHACNPSIPEAKTEWSQKQKQNPQIRKQTFAQENKVCPNFLFWNMCRKHLFVTIIKFMKYAVFLLECVNKF
jgi:hypothetical protein